MSNREPAFFIGLAVSLVVAILGVLTGQGVISQIHAGTVTDAVTALASLATIIAPLIAGLLIKRQVTPTASPVLPAGTPVTTPDGKVAVVAPV